MLFGVVHLVEVRVRPLLGDHLPSVDFTRIDTVLLHGNGDVMIKKKRMQKAGITQNK